MTFEEKSFMKDERLKGCTGADAFVVVGTGAWVVSLKCQETL